MAMVQVGLAVSQNRVDGRNRVSSGRKFNRIATVVILCLVVSCLGFVSPVHGASALSEAQAQPKTRTATSKTTTRKNKKPQKTPLPPLASGPTGPVQPIPLDSIAPVAPQVSYQNAQLTIVAANSTLGDILRAVRKQTGAEIEIPVATERVVTHLGPGSARDVIAELLNGSRFNYVLLGSPADSAVLTRVVLVAKTGPDNAISNNPNPSVAEQAQPGMVQRPGGPGAATLPAVAGEANDADAIDNNTDDAADQAAAEAEQPPASPDQPAVKTPQQMLQEMQQRQLQLQQQQQQTGQPPYSNRAGVPPQPPPQQQ